MDDLLKWLPLLNVAVIPAAYAAWRLSLEMQAWRLFMAECLDDRRRLWATVRPMEREMLKRGMLNGIT